MSVTVTEPADAVAGLARRFEIAYGRAIADTGLAHRGAAIAEARVALEEVAEVEAVARTRQRNDRFDADMSDAEVVAGLFGASVARDGRAEGRADWEDRLADGAGRADLLAAPVRAGEAEDRIDVIGGSGLAVGDFVPATFRCGVASGDPEPDPVVLWTHARPAGTDAPSPSAGRAPRMRTSHHPRLGQHDDLGRPRPQRQGDPRGLRALRTLFLPRHRRRRDLRHRRDPDPDRGRAGRAEPGQRLPQRPAGRRRSRSGGADLLGPRSRRSTSPTPPIAAIWTCGSRPGRSRPTVSVRTRSTASITRPGPSPRLWRPTSSPERGTAVARARAATGRQRDSARTLG